MVFPAAFNNYLPTYFHNQGRQLNYIAKVYQKKPIKNFDTFHDFGSSSNILCSMLTEKFDCLFEEMEISFIYCFMDLY